MSYFSLLTSAGAAALASAVANATAVNLTEVGFGDGGGSVPTPNISTTALVNEVYRTVINSIAQDPGNPGWYIIEAIIPPATGGFWIREFRIDDINGTAIFVGNLPPEYKPAFTEGTTRDSVYRLIVETSNAATINLTVDGSIAAATIDYVDNKFNEFDYKKSVRVATTANTALSGLLTIDGVTLVAGDRVLVRKNTTGSENGIYTAASGAWARATDADTSSKVTPGLMVTVEEGAVNADAVFILSTNRTIILGTTSLAFLRVGEHGSKRITASSTFTVPDGVYSISVSGCAGGGGGAGGGGSSTTTPLVGAGGGGGGAGQSIINTPYSVTPGTSISITIGGGGTAGIGIGGSDGTNGGAGGNTVVGTLVTLTGGTGGAKGIVGSAASHVPGPPGGAGYPQGGYAEDTTANNSSGNGGTGASGPFGGGGGLGRGAADIHGGDATQGYGYGAGGGGGGGMYASTSTLRGGNGSAGLPGLVIIEW
jgi:hypothetical protein